MKSKKQENNLFIIYVYDIIYENKENRVRLKRKFYYHLNRLLEQTPLGAVLRPTKSTIIIPIDLEFYFDDLFRSFGNDILVYKGYLASPLELFK